MRVLVTGAAGMLGRAVLEHLEPRHQVTGVDLEVDVTDAGAVAACLARTRPEAVLHLAAVTDVDGAEGDPQRALLVNGQGTDNVARACARAGCALVYPSTDYVFDGTKGAPYLEDDPPAPLSAYGRSKRAGEIAALGHCPAGARVARTAWLYGAGGKNFVDTMLALGAEREQVSVVCDQVGSPTWAADLAPALEALIDLPPGIYHAAGAGSVSWAGFAEAIFAAAGLECRVRPITSAALGRPAPRPAYAPLAVSRPGAPRLRGWQEALQAYLQSRVAA
jgi:dTDP-4-dehydrorhamnose reductase